MNPKVSYLFPDEQTTELERYSRLDDQIVQALNTDVELVAREARDRGRIEGMIAAACFVIIPLVLIDVLTLI